MGLQYLIFITIHAIPSGLKIKFGKDKVPVKLTSAGPHGTSVLGLGITLGTADRQIYRMDFGDINPNHVGQNLGYATPKANELLAWNDVLGNNFHFHVMKP